MEEIKPQYLILARHGTYDETTGKLDENGRENVSKLAEKLKKDYLYELKPKIFYSPLQRTRETAEIYARAFNIPLEEMQEENSLRGTKDDPTTSEEIKVEKAAQTLEKALSSNKAQAYLFITHEDTAIDSTKLFLKRNFNIDEEIETMQFASAFLIELKNPKEVIRLRP